MLIPYPSSNEAVERISNRYFDRKKPFNSGKKIFFPDVILWESIKEFLENLDEEDTVYFISNNHNDFAEDDKKTLHSDFFSDIPVLLENNVKLLNDLKAFFEHVDENDQHLIDLQIRIGSEGFDKEMECFLESSDEITEFLQNTLINKTFESEYYEGWGDNPYIDWINLEHVEAGFSESENGILEFEVILGVSFDIVTKSPVYERGIDDYDEEYLSKSTSRTFTLTGEVEYKFKDNEFRNMRNLRCVSR